jgi:hypothetical protein
MTSSEWERNEDLPPWLQDALGILESQTILDEIKEELRARLSRPMEEDFIDREVHGSGAWLPRRIYVHGVEIEIQQLHRKGLGSKDVKGADLLYEIVGKKFILIQYKTPDKKNCRVKRDKGQLCELMRNCQAPCPPYLSTLNYVCGSWVAIEDPNGARFLPACRAYSIFEPYKSKYASEFECGITRPTFRELFAKCLIGSRTSAQGILSKTLAAPGASRSLYFVQQFGEFSK